RNVTGVQTCALPISAGSSFATADHGQWPHYRHSAAPVSAAAFGAVDFRSRKPQPFLGFHPLAGSMEKEPLLPLPTGSPCRHSGAYLPPTLANLGRAHV